MDSYWILTNGLKIQWGLQPYVPNQTVNLPINFTSGNTYIAIDTNVYNGGANNEIATIRILSASSFTYGTYNDRPITWIAIGY